jgi:hypothetical protein
LSQKKSQNSLLLLTTLGVYLGLLVAGAAPGVVAQQAAAMTRNFELSEEVEVKDDLDNKPDDQASELDPDVDLAALEIIVASYLERVIDISLLSGAAIRSTVAIARRTDNVSTSLPADYTPSDVKNSANFAYQQFPRAGLDPLPATSA